MKKQTRITHGSIAFCRRRPRHVCHSHHCQRRAERTRELEGGREAVASHGPYAGPGRHVALSCSLERRGGRATRQRSAQLARQRSGGTNSGVMLLQDRSYVASAHMVASSAELVREQASCGKLQLMISTTSTRMLVFIPACYLLCSNSPNLVCCILFNFRNLSQSM